MTTRHRREPGSDVLVHRSSPLHPDDRAVIDAVPVTSVARTFVDLTEELPSERRLADAVHEPVRRLFDLGQVERALARVSGRRGRYRLQRVIRAYGEEPPLTRSEGERRFLELCEEAACQLLMPTFRLAAVVVSYGRGTGWRSRSTGPRRTTRRAFYADRRRDRRLAAIGIQVLRVTWEDLDEDAAEGVISRETS